MKNRIKQIIAGLLVVVITNICMPIGVYALGDNGNNSNGSGTSSSGSRFTWSQYQSGYRFSIVNNDFEQVSNTVDILFNRPAASFGANNKNLYTNSRASGILGNSTSNWAYTTFDQLISGGTIPSKPAPPIYYQGNSNLAQAGGFDFKEWFFYGQGEINSVQPPLYTGGNGVTEPDLKDEPNANKELAAVSLYMIYIDYQYRLYKYSDSLLITLAQGYFDHAKSVILTLTNHYQALIEEMEKYSQDMEFSRATILSPNLHELSIKKLSNSYAESIFIYTSVINELGGATWSPPGYIIEESYHLASVDSEYGKAELPVIATNRELTLDKIPLAGNNFNGHAEQILNTVLSKDGSGIPTSRLFKFTSSAIANMKNKEGVNSSRDPFVVIDENNYYIVVEPIFWFKPDSATGIIHPNYIYGTVANIVDFYYEQNYRYGDTGGNYRKLTSDIGWTSMYLGKDFTNSSGRIVLSAIVDPNGSRTSQTLKSMKDVYNNGIAMHLYVTSAPIDGATLPTGASNWPRPANTPDPSDETKPETIKNAPEGYTKEYNVIKCYEDVYEDGTIEPQSSYIRKNTPPQIQMVDEQFYKVTNWFITKQDMGGLQASSDGTIEDESLDTYGEVKGKVKATREGTSAETVFIDENKPDKVNNEKTLVLLLQRKVVTADVNSVLTLNESEVSKAITTNDTSIPNWGPREFKFTYSSMSDNDDHSKYHSATETRSSYTEHHYCTAVFGDASYSYLVENIATLNNELEANSAGGAFSYKMLNNTMSGSASIGGGTNTIDKAEYQTVIWRGLDIPTIASYKESSSIVLNSLLGRYGKEPAGGRGLNGSYQALLNIQLSAVNSPDLSTHSIHSYTGSTWHSVTHDWASVSPHEGTVNVNVYAGDDKKTVGDETVKTEILTTTPFGGSTSIHSAGYMVQAVNSLYFYPYIRMTYQTTGQNDKTTVNVLSQFYSKILPNSFAEAAWYNPNEKESLSLSSVQWSLHAKAVNGGKDWNGANQVLPGGALYQLNTEKSTTKVSLVTWQPVVADPERNALTVALPENEFTVDRARIYQESFVEQAKQVLERLRVVQWVNSATNATNAWTNNGKAVKITDGGQSLSALGLSGTTSTEGKYRLGKDESGDAANEGDLDVITATDSADTYFKIFSDVSGNVYMAKSVGDMGALANINGDNVGSAEKLLTQKDTVTALAKLKGDAKELDTRTKMITNFVKALERGKGNDPTAKWGTGGKWYNEAWDGIYVVRKATVLDVGFNLSKTRTAAIDPKLMPKNNGQSDLFSKAYLSQFRTNDSSDSSIAQGKPSGYIGTFQGQDIILKDMENMYISKKFYIPNVSVSDLS